MSGKKPAEPSPESLARAKRQRLAQEDGARAMADLERQAIDVRKNMERLRGLREAKEAEAATTQTVAPKGANKKRTKRTLR